MTCYPRNYSRFYNSWIQTAANMIHSPQSALSKVEIILIQLILIYVSFLLDKFYHICVTTQAVISQKAHEVWWLQKSYIQTPLDQWPVLARSYNHISCDSLIITTTRVISEVRFVGIKGCAESELNVCFVVSVDKDYPT
jgi:hypothetical protein